MQGLAVPFHLLPAVKRETQRIVKLIMCFIVFQLEPKKKSLSFYQLFCAQTSFIFFFFFSVTTAHKQIIKHFTLGAI